MAKVPGFARAFVGRWRIVEMDNWDGDFLDLVEQAHLTFKGKSDGEIAFGALKGFLDVRYGARDGSACAEFSWEGHDDNDPTWGRGWAMIGTAGRLVGHFYIHNGAAKANRTLGEVSRPHMSRCPTSVSKQTALLTCSKTWRAKPSQTSIGIFQMRTNASSVRRRPPSNLLVSPASRQNCQ
jgi:hypothetical protein